MAVAFRLFRAHGYEGTLVEQIAHEAGVSRRTFYRYFTSKDDLLAERGLEVTEAVLKRVGTAPSAGELLGAYSTVVEQAVANGDLGVVVQLMRENPRLVEAAPLWRQRWIEHLAQQLAARQGRDAPSLDCRLVSGIVIHLLTLALDEWRTRPDTAIEEAVREVAATARGALDDLDG